MFSPVTITNYFPTLKIFLAKKNLMAACFILEINKSLNMLDINGWTWISFWINTGLSTLFTFELYSMYSSSRVLQKYKILKTKKMQDIYFSRLKSQYNLCWSYHINYKVYWGKKGIVTIIHIGTYKNILQPLVTVIFHLLPSQKFLIRQIIMKA